MHNAAPHCCSRARRAAGVTYSYDALGRVNNRPIDTGNSVSTTFDALGRVTGFTNALTPSGSFTYTYFDPSHPTNRIGSITYPNGQSTTFNYFGKRGRVRMALT
jgi:hypothetical protein